MARLTTRGCVMGVHPFARSCFTAQRCSAWRHDGGASHRQPYHPRGAVERDRQAAHRKHKHGAWHAGTIGPFEQHPCASSFPCDRRHRGRIRGQCMVCVPVQLLVVDAVHLCLPMPSCLRTIALSLYRSTGRSHTVHWHTISLRGCTGGRHVVQTAAMLLHGHGVGLLVTRIGRRSVA